MNIRKGKVNRVLSPNYLDIEFYLEFGVSIRVCVTIEGLDPHKEDKDLHDKLMHSLVIMVGGKNIIIRPSEGETFPATRTAFTGAIYRKGEIEDCTVEIEGEKYICIKKYLTKMFPDFDIKAIRNDWRKIK